MQRFMISFIGRRVGAIGVFYQMQKTLEADDADDALLKLYDTHEHVQRPQIRELADGEPTPADTD